MKAYLYAGHVLLLGVQSALISNPTRRVIHNVVVRDINCRFDGAKFTMEEDLNTMYLIRKERMLDLFTIFVQRLKEWKKFEFETIEGEFI